MRVSRRVANFNKRITNPAALRVVDRMPGLGILYHVGRRSGARYRTPLLVFDTTDGFALLVGYGPQTHWVRNVLAGGDTAICKHRKTVAVGHPVLLAKSEVAPQVSPASRWLYRLFPYNESVMVLKRL